MGHLYHKLGRFASAFCPVTPRLETAFRVDHGSGPSPLSCCHEQFPVQDAVHIVEKCQRAATTVSGASASLQPALLATQRDKKAELNRRSEVCAVLAGTGVRVAGKSLERGCG